MQAHTSNDDNQFRRKVVSKTRAHNYGRKTRVKTHNGEKPYNCDLCHKSFKRSTILKNHKRTHTGENPYKCDLCRKSFTQKRYLEDHKRIHTGERPYKCKLCHKSFTQKYHLGTHNKTHIGKKPHKVNLCEETFVHREDLTTCLGTSPRDRPQEFSFISKNETASEGCLEGHTMTETEDKLWNSELFEICSSRTSEGCDKSSAHKECSISTEDDNCVDGKDLLITEAMQGLSLWQSNNEHPKEQVSEDLANSSYVPYGCGICDAMFDINEEFIVHCYHHYSENPKNDAFQELFEMYLQRFSP